VVQVTAQRQNFGIGVLGGPTTVIDVAGRRFVVDPTFDPPGLHAYLMKTAPPTIGPDALGAVDVVLISHDEHPDNLDDAGRRFALATPTVITNASAAQRLGPPAIGLSAWDRTELPADGDRTALTVRAVPAVHGPADAERDERGHVTCEVVGFVISGDGVPTIYVSGDNASMSVVSAISREVGTIDVAVLFVGAARVPLRHGGRPLTLTSERAAAAAEVLGAPVVVTAHVDGWTHFTEDAHAVERAFVNAGIGHVLTTAPLGEWALPSLPASR
jgi:L-ascorbate metabolism protein UlaG (beta-lactamase superfamily)